MTHDNIESEDEVEISTASNDKGRNSGEKNDQWMCVLEIQMLQWRKERTIQAN